MKRTPEQVREIIKEKVLGKWVACHDERGHHYRHTDSGVVVDSVTTQNIIEKPHLGPWMIEKALDYFVEHLDFYDEENKKQIYEGAKNAFRTIRDTAGDIGTASHDIIETYIKDWIPKGIRQTDIRDLIPADSDGRIFAACRSVEQLFNSHPEITPIATELLVGDILYGSAGTLDFLVMIDGKLYLWDWKTSNQVNDFYSIQVSIYAKMFTRMTGLKIHGCIVAKLSKDFASVKLYDVPNMNGAIKTFKHLNRVYSWFKDGQEKLVERKNRLTITK